MGHLGVGAEGHVRETAAACGFLCTAETPDRG
jgi:hypothetical protein